MQIHWRLPHRLSCREEWLRQTPFQGQRRLGHQNTAKKAEKANTLRQIATEDGHRTLRTRRGRVRSLPLPPMLDPRITAAQTRHTKTKALLKHADYTPLQRSLAANPYGTAALRFRFYSI